MRRCVECGKATLSPHESEDSVSVAGRTFVRQVSALRCENCGATYFEGAALGAVELDAAGVIASEGPCCGETFGFMRKALGLRAAELAELLDLSPETLSRWENAQRPVDRASWVALSVLVLERQEGREATLERLRALLQPSSLSERVRLASRRA